MEGTWREAAHKVAFWMSTGRMLFSSHAEMPNVVTVEPIRANTCRHNQSNFSEMTLEIYM